MTPGTIPALTLRPASARAALAIAGGRFKPELFHGGPGSPLQLEEIPRPHRPPGWIRVEPRLGGICASDRKLLHLTGMGTTLLPLFGFPRQGIVPGHEVVGVVTEADVGGPVREGDRVVVEPLVSCVDKGLSTCRSCQEGDDHLCERLPDAGEMHAGGGFGLNVRYGGGWAAELVAPARRAVRVPDSIDDKAAVLAEPVAIGVHAVARTPLPRDAQVLLIGPGAIGLTLLYALKALVPAAKVTVAGVHPFADDLARRAGAGAVIHGTRAALIEAAGESLGTDVLGNRISGPLLRRGFDAVFDTVGSPQTLDDALRMTRPGGTVVLVGTATKQKVDWSLVWARELTIRGTVYYGDDTPPERARVAPGKRRAMAIAVDVLADAKPDHLVTHIHTLDQAPNALATSSAGPSAEAVKVAFAPNA